MDLAGFWNGSAWTLLEEIASLGPLATFVVAVAAWRTYRQKTKADLRDQGWKRAEWAIELALRDDRESRLAGMVAISELSAGSVVTKEDKRLFGSVSTSVQSEVRKKVAGVRRGLCRGRRHGKAGQ